MLNKSLFHHRETITFRRFSRRGYALFACLGREVRVGVLTVATLGAAAPCLATDSKPTSFAVAEQGLEADSTDTRLAEALISATRAPLAADVAARIVTTLSQRDLEAAGVTSVNDLLKLAAGVDVRQRGGFGVQTDISIDGGTFDQICILVNGIAITNPQTGHNAADFPLNTADIERVEILRGAASRVFGSQAFSGAINVVTKGAAKTGVEATVEGGSYGTVLAQARGAWAVSPRFSSSLSVGAGRSDGAVDNGDFKQLRAYWQGHYADEALTLQAQAGLTANDFGANTFYSAAYPNQWEATRRYFVALKGETRGRVHFAPQVSWLRSSDHFQLIRGTHTGENFHRGDVLTVGMGAWTQWALGKTAVGAELRDESLYSTNLGLPLADEQLFTINGHPDIYYNHHASRTNVSYYLEHNLVAGNWTVSAGVMAQRNSMASRTFRFFPGIDVSYRPTSAWRLFASCNRSMRLPSFTDLWYKSPTQEGNVGLQPETSTSYRLGTEWLGRGWKVSAEGFHNRGHNMIDWVMYSPTDIYHATSFALSGYGASLTAELALAHLLGNRQPLQRLRVDYTYLYQHRDEGTDYYKSNYALEYLRHKLTVALDHKIVSRLAATWTLRLWEREGGYVVYDGGLPTDQLRPYGLHALLDCRLKWRGEHYELFADLTNLTDTRYFDLANVRQPGFMLMAGAKVSF